MIILLILITVFAIGLAIAIMDYSTWGEPVGGIIAIIGGVLLLVAIICFPVERIINRSFIAQYQGAKATIEIARKTDTKLIETTAMQLKIIEINQEIANLKYWNGTLFDIWIVDEAANLEPLN